MTVMAVIQTDAAGCASSHLTTGFSGSLRIRAEMTLVSRTIIPRNPLVGPRSVAARGFPRPAQARRDGRAGRFPFPAACLFGLRAWWRRARFHALLLRRFARGASLAGSVCLSLRSRASEQ